MPDSIPQRGVIPRFMTWLLGANWRQEISAACGYVQGITGTLAGGTLLSAGQPENLGVPWLAHHWLAIVGWSTIINGLLSAVSKKFPPNTVTQ